jgi:hypothetical protein
MQTQKEFMDACSPPKNCPSCLWVSFAVCLEKHPDLSPEVADLLERLFCDRRREIVKLVMAPMRLIRHAWSRPRDSGDPIRYPYYGNCLDFRPRWDACASCGYTDGCLNLNPSADAEFSLLGVDSSKLFVGPDANSLSQKLGKIMLSTGLKTRLMSLEDDDELGYRGVVDQVLSYLSDESDWSCDEWIVAGSALLRLFALQHTRGGVSLSSAFPQQHFKIIIIRRHLRTIAGEIATINAPLPTCFI